MRFISGENTAGPIPKVKKTAAPNQIAAFSNPTTRRTTCTRASVGRALSKAKRGIGRSAANPKAEARNPRYQTSRLAKNGDILRTGSLLGAPASCRLPRKNAGKMPALPGRNSTHVPLVIVKLLLLTPEIAVQPVNLALDRIAHRGIGLRVQ